MPMKTPPHPGGFVLRQCIEPLDLTITQAATASVDTSKPATDRHFKTGHHGHGGRDQ